MSEPGLALAKPSVKKSGGLGGRMGGVAKASPDQPDQPGWLNAEARKRTMREKIT